MAGVKASFRKAVTGKILHRACVFTSSVLVMLGTVHGQSTAAQGNDQRFEIKAMTRVNESDHTGYFGDPYPIHLSPWLAPFLPEYFSGTTPGTLACERPIRQGCFSETPLTVVPGPALRNEAQAHGNAFGDVINRNIYQDMMGNWQMAVTLYVHPAGDAQDPTRRWTVIAHAHPRENRSLVPPTEWVADTVLVGSLVKKAFANYDGKYLNDEGRLYLVYSKCLAVCDAKGKEKPGRHDGIVAQRMERADKRSPEEPVTLLGPASGDEALTSEYFLSDPNAPEQFKLIETGNITKIADKYVMAYSVGDYQQPNYKSGVAYSDTLIPRDGKMYRKVLAVDTEGVWGTPGKDEVRYILQSQKPAWPNYARAKVIAPGVPSIVEQPDGQFLLFFDGFLPTDAPRAHATPNNPYNIEANHRRPFFIPLEVRVPVNGSVEAYTNAEIQHWITPKVSAK